MRLKILSISDKKIFSKFLSLNKHRLAVYAFENIYIWRGLFDIKWLVLEDNLCIFFKDKIGCFLYLPPLSAKKNPAAIKKAFEIMDRLNKNKNISRIENIEEEDACFYQSLGYDCGYKFSDYLCRRADLVHLKGNRFKSKRSCINYFIKHYKFEYLPFSLRYKDNCAGLYNFWMSERKTHNQDSIYQGMLGDSRTCLKILLDNFRDLNFIGRIVKLDKEIKGFTFGFKLNPETFCILYEVTDLSIRGLSQFIFWKFCGELKDYKYINIMDDSGLKNLKKVKLSYHPISLIPAYIAKRKDG